MHKSMAVANPRNAAMDEIAEAARLRREADIANDGTVVDLDDPIVDLGDGDVDLQIVDNGVNHDNNPIIDRDGDQYIQLNVNGVLKEVPVADAVIQLQKEGNADYQTQLAVEERKTLTAEVARLQAEAAAPSTQPDDVEAAKAERKGSVRAALQKLYEDGDVDGSADIIADLIEGKQAVPAETIDDTRVVQIMDQREKRRDLGDAYNRFKSEDRFKSVIDDPDMMMILDKTTQRLQEDPQYMASNPSYHDIFTKAGEVVLEKFNPSQVPSDPVDEILEGKRAAPAAVASRTARRTAPVPEKPKTTASIIGDIAKARGQSGY
jgi:hypothetical protein